MSYSPHTINVTAPVKSTLLLILLCIMTAVSIAQRPVRGIVAYDDYAALETDILQVADNDTVYVINFWATWCGPCVKELPFFYDIDRRITSHPIKVILVSLDFEKQLDKRLFPFLQKEKVPLEVVVFLDPDANSWIDKIDPSWSGAIPYTILLAGPASTGAERSFATHNELDAFVTTFINTL